MARLDVNNHSPDIFAIVCFNDSFQLALDLATIEILLRVCKRARPLLSSKLPRFRSWCQNAGLCRPDGQLRIGLTPSNQISLSLRCRYQESPSRSWLVARTYRGDAAASYLLAMILRADLNGGQITEFKQEATRRYIVHLLKSAADNDHTMAQFHLAECHLNGSKVDRSHTKALNLYRKLASRGISQAQVALGQRYEAGEGVDRDFDTAIEWYTKAADQGSEDGRHHIMFLRGWASFIGHSVEQSDIGALSYWQEVSTKSTNPVLKSIATHMVGWMHYLGRGTQQDELKGVKIIRENESHGFKLGEDQCLGSNWNSVSSDSHAAHKFFELCQLGSDKIWLCKHLMAVCLVNGFGTAQDQKRAANAFQQLASEGHAASQFWLGGCYYNHWGVSQDYRQAFEWYNKSAEQDNSYGQWMVGLCYSGGAGVLKDDNKAAEWFRRSAEQGNRCGQNALGRCYKDGKGVAEDIETAAFWYCKAADQGHLYAVKALKELV